jgi:transcriptional regulator with XRE-family HTH domain
MARKEIKIEFSRWLDHGLKARALTQTELRRLLERAGVETSRQTVSQWVNGDNVPLPDTVVVIAQILGTPPAEALRRAGHIRVAELVEHPAENDTPTAPPVDPVIQRILDDPLIPSDLKDRAITFYKRRIQQAQEDLQNFGLTGPDTP